MIASTKRDVPEMVLTNVLNEKREVGAMSYTMSAIIRRRLSEENNPERRETLLQLLALYEPLAEKITWNPKGGPAILSAQFPQA
jgi:hypothetical protein